jgi:sugar transferase (PEP-CTERM/EpsH1 system associated)
MSTKPGLLFVSHRLLYPPDKGERIRGWGLLRHLSAHYDIHLGCLNDAPPAPGALEALRGVCAEVVCFVAGQRQQKLHALLRLRPGRPLMLDYYHHAGLERWVDGVMAGKPMEILYIYSAAMAPYVLKYDQPGRILDMQDIDSEKWTSYAARAPWPMSLVWAREGRTLAAFERTAARACDATLLVTKKEAERFAELAPECADRIDWLEHGVDSETFAPGQDFPNPYADLPGAGPDLVFTGNMDYWPNADAVIWFAGAVMPELRRHHPGLRLHIVGANPGPDVTALGRLEGVHVTGRVADVRPYVAHAALAIAPLRIARGIQNKVLEAMAMARPVVASPGAFEGIEAEPGRDLLVADGAAATVGAVLEVLAGQHPGLGAAGRALIEARYSSQSGLARLDRILAAARREGHS